MKPHAAPGPAPTQPAPEPNPARPGSEPAGARRAPRSDPAADRVLERTRRYIEIETPTGAAAEISALAELLEADLAAAGASVERLDAPGYGCHLLARVPGSDPGQRPLLVLGHFDTVCPLGTLARRPFRIEGGRAEGPGIFDMKAPLAVLVEALLDMRDAGSRPARPLEILLTCDEEVGSRTSRRAIEERAAGAGVTLVLEPPLPGGAAKTARKGVAVYRVDVTGRAAHAGLEPERGVSAIAELARQLADLLGLADPAAGTTVNVGRIGGGTAVNVVPESAWADLEVRFVTVAEADRVDAAIRGVVARLDGAVVTVERTELRPPLERTPGVVALFEHARAIAAELGFELGEGSAGGASDGCLTAALGVPTLDGLGVDGGGAHAEHEHILTADIGRRVRLVRRLLETV